MNDAVCQQHIYLKTLLRTNTFSLGDCRAPAVQPWMPQGYYKNSRVHT